MGGAAQACGASERSLGTAVLVGWSLALSQTSESHVRRGTSHHSFVFLFISELKKNYDLFILIFTARLQVVVL